MTAEETCWKSVKPASVCRAASCAAGDFFCCTVDDVTTCSDHQARREDGLLQPCCSGTLLRGVTPGGRRVMLPSMGRNDTLTHQHAPSSPVHRCSPAFNGSAVQLYNKHGTPVSSSKWPPEDTPDLYSATENTHTHTFVHTYLETALKQKQAAKY